MTQPHQRNRHPKYRKKYKIHNWRSYERSLVNRVDLTLWLSEDVIQSWYGDSNDLVGRPKVSSDLAICYRTLLKVAFQTATASNGKLFTFFIQHNEGRFSCT